MDPKEQMFIDAEYCIDKYFDEHLKSRLDSYMMTRESTRVSEMSTGFGVRNTFFPSEEYATNVTLAFPSRDIDKLCMDLDRDPHDIDTLASAWRTAAVQKVGQERYDELSDSLGGDLARAYVGHRMMMKMVDYEAEKHPLRGSADYIFDEARRSSILHYLSAPQSAIQDMIDKRIVERYDPSLLEKGVGKTLGSATDFAITAPVLGISSWAGLAKFVAVDVGIGFVGDAINDAAMSRNDVGKEISYILFDGNRDKLDSFRHQARSANPYGSELIKAADEQLKNKLVRRSSTNPFTLQVSPLGLEPQFSKLPELPDYVSQLKEQGEMYFAMKEKFGDSNTGQMQTANTEQSTEQQAQENKTKDIGGWGGLLDNLGLSGIGHVGKNLGYVLAMLPDILIGMFTGKSRNLKFGDNLLPIGAIITGLFVKNPLLKMLLVGFGGANLLNKAGQEALEDRDGKQTQPVRQYRQYVDEVLDGRIKQPIMRGNTLIASIDNVPSVITINDEAVDAYEKGMLPLNTLANAVLRKYDEQKEALEENFDRQQLQDNLIERSRGLK